MKTRLPIFLFMFIMVNSCNHPRQEEFPEMKLLEEAELNQIGKSHNYFLEQIFNEFDWTTNDMARELGRQLERVAKNQNFDFDSHSTIRYFSRCDGDCLLNNYSKPGRSIVQKAISNISVHQDLVSMNQNITHLKQEARIILKDPLELNKVLATLEILKNSAEFWSPVNYGGNGKGDYIIKKIQSRNMEKKLSPCAAAIVKDDALAAGSEMIISAFVLGLSGGPITAGAFFGYVGITAAVSSGWSALQNCNK